MPAVDVVLQKEMIDEQIMDGQIAVIIDVLLATTTIAATLEHGAASVIPVRDSSHAAERKIGLPAETFVLAGELEGKIIEGFLAPWPVSLKQHVSGKTLILSTSNGTVAINKCHKAKKIYTSSFLNGEHVASYIKKIDKGENLVVVCSGSDGSFSLEDFLGAGYFLNSLVGNSEEKYTMTDAARTALYFYKKHEDSYQDLLEQSIVGRELAVFGLIDEVRYAAERGSIRVVPEVTDDRIVDALRNK
ncbi:2-phosphosulfolactate phosphatase [Bacillus sp. T33-2]|uniref:2-phosphosulfolactate phosphatase n=1 Tax=Bacillus sp. T33-2 TaxID=2054168 RepID=UPI000C77F47F|nr:2-phosphosulfolactate phosphatase [Bacillus sp. T33-2]PLR94444.1 2-phosphosulfolactate phosphatase [Bacillus sp. T33-2]